MKLAESLAELAQQLEQSGVPFAVIGGLAASARGEARFTRDIDVAVDVADDSRAERLLFDVGQRGYRVTATVKHDVTARLATARTLDRHGIVCDLVFATSGIEPEVVSSATRIGVFDGFVVPTATVESLLAMKILSAVPARPRDAGDIQAMVRANPSFDERRVSELLAQIQARGYGRQQDLAKKWCELKKALQL